MYDAMSDSRIAHNFPSEHFLKVGSVVHQAYINGIPIITFNPSGMDIIRCSVIGLLSVAFPIIINPFTDSFYPFHVNKFKLCVSRASITIKRFVNAVPAGTVWNLRGI